MMTKTERVCRKPIQALRDLFGKDGHPDVPVPLPRRFRRAARYLEHRGELVSMDAVKRPGTPTVVRGYLVGSQRNRESVANARMSAPQG